MSLDSMYCHHDEARSVLVAMPKSMERTASGSQVGTKKRAADVGVSSSLTLIATLQAPGRLEPSRKPVSQGEETLG